MHEGWETKSANRAVLSKVFTDREGKSVLFEVAQSDISSKPEIDLDELADDALRTEHLQRPLEFRFTGSHFHPVFKD